MAETPVSTPPASEEEESWGAAMQKASDEAVAMIMDMFGLSKLGESKVDDGGPEGGVRGVGTSYYFGDGGINGTKITQVVRTEFESFYDSVMGFVSAVHWSEPWIIALLSFHFILLVAAVATRNRSEVQMGLFVFLLGCVYLAETLNGLGAKHWKSFSTQNYFDSKGLWMSCVFSLPLLLIAIVMLVQSLFNASNLLVKVKRQQLQSQVRQARREGGSGGGEAQDNKKEK